MLYVEPPTSQLKETLMTVSREQATEAMLSLTEGAELVAVGIPMHLSEHPELDNDTREILEQVLVVLPLLCSVTRQSFVSALNAEDALDEVKDWIDKHEKK